jgi:hypothetical protein
MGDIADARAAVVDSSEPLDGVKQANPVSHVANFTPRSPAGATPEERAQRRSLKARCQVDVHPSEELAEPDPAMTTNVEDHPETSGDRNHEPQKDAPKEQQCDTSANRSPRRSHVLIVGAPARLVFGETFLGSEIGDPWAALRSPKCAPSLQGSTMESVGVSLHGLELR